MILLPERLLDNIYPCPVTGCWHWGGRWNSGNGYGKICWQGRHSMAHRVVYALLIGEIPEGLILDHLCRVRVCVNPEHLEPVSVQVNTLRGDAVLFQPAQKIEGPRARVD